ncbi:MAG: hypothetical protein LBT65_07225, partial [Synergistaceae bacterium]|nr:hypothetical protein [Synergistaceae bacterium]
ALPISVHKEWRKHIENQFQDRLLGIIHSAAEVKRVSEMKELLCEGDKGNRAYKEHLTTAQKITTIIKGKGYEQL